MYDGVGNSFENIKNDWMHLVDDSGNDWLDAFAKVEVISPVNGTCMNGVNLL